LVDKKSDENRKSEFALAGEGGSFGTMLPDEIGFVQALKKLCQCEKRGAARVLRVVITWPWIWLLGRCNYMIMNDIFQIINSKTGGFTGFFLS